MDIIIKHWLPILALLLPMIATAILFAVFKSGELNRTARIVLGASSTAAVLSGTGLAVFVLCVGGGAEVILPLLLLPLLITLI